MIAAKVLIKFRFHNEQGYMTGRKISNVGRKTLAHGLSQSFKK